MVSTSEAPAALGGGREGMSWGRTHVVASLLGGALRQEQFQAV